MHTHACVLVFICKANNDGRASPTSAPTGLSPEPLVQPTLKPGGGEGNEQQPQGWLPASNPPTTLLAVLSCCELGSIC